MMKKNDQLPAVIRLWKAVRKLREQHDRLSLCLPISMLNEHGEIATVFDILDEIEGRKTRYLPALRPPNSPESDDAPLLSNGVTRRELRKIIRQYKKKRSVS